MIGNKGSVRVEPFDKLRMDCARAASGVETPLSFDFGLCEACAQDERNTDERTCA
jgi:hypothetical protein